MANTKGEGKSGDDFWQKAEVLLYTALIGFIPVSYTHLDVYKRQPLERDAGANEKRLSPLWGKALWRRRWDSNPRTGY